MEDIAIIVAHPDDVAYGLSGTLLQLGTEFKLHVICATRGERGLAGKKSMQETATIREKEEMAACKLLNAELTFLDLIDREVFADKTNSERLGAILTEIKPRAVFTIWSIDCHPDHSAVSELTKKALFLTNLDTELYFFEESFGEQTTQFDPDIYVDISEVLERKLGIIRCHVCQNSNDRLAQSSIIQSAHRGLKCQVGYAEGFKVVAAHTVDKAKTIFDKIQ